MRTLSVCGEIGSLVAMITQTQTFAVFADYNQFFLLDDEPAAMPFAPRAPPPSALI